MRPRSIRAGSGDVFNMPASCYVAGAIATELFVVPGQRGVDVTGGKSIELSFAQLAELNSIPAITQIRAEH